MKSYYVSYIKYGDPNIQSEEIDFEDNAPVNQQTIKKEIESIFNRWYNFQEVKQIISWSKIEE
jgi:hypothetical protein